MPHATTPQGVPRPRILFIDAHDSFTNNIVSLLETHLGVEVTIIHIDDKIADFATFIKPFAAAIAGPGPGDPRNPEDVGLIGELWELGECIPLLPVLGVCLGFQSLVLNCGGSIERLSEPRHGIIRKVRSSGRSIFQGHEFVETVQYHSLHASLGHSSQDTSAEDIWGLSSACPSLRPLAYDFESDNIEGSSLVRNLSGTPLNEVLATDTAVCTAEMGQRCGANICAICDASKPLEEYLSSSAVADAQNKRLSKPILMAVEHVSKPFFGLQFHPESICSSENARAIISSWWDHAMDWNAEYRSFAPLLHSPLNNKVIPNPNPRRRNNSGPGYCLCGEPVPSSIPSLARDRATTKLHSQVIDTAALTVPSICVELGIDQGDAVILDSEMHQMDEVGQYSIIGVITPDTIRIEYKIGRQEVVLTDAFGRKERVGLEHFGGSIFSYLKSFMALHRADVEHVQVPFSGGLVGHITYEACLETIGIRKTATQSSASSGRPDLSFAFIERSVVIDHFQQSIHIQSIKADDEQWVNDTISRLQNISLQDQPVEPDIPKFEAQITLPDAENYKAQIRTCQSSIRAGDSYELCLTTQVTIQTSTRLPEWPLYRRLRKLNPSPFSAYLRLGKLTLLCSSPERFLRWLRPKPSWKHEGQKTSICQFRPIKGTVKRQPNPNHPPLNLAQATALLSTPKERAENLMIVDLIRHDLHGVVGSGRVSVPKLMVVEEYATLFQLVSVVEGSLIVEGSLVVEEGEDDLEKCSAESLEDDNALPRTGTTINGAHNTHPTPIKTTTPGALQTLQTPSTILDNTKTTTTTTTSNPHLLSPPHHTNFESKSGIDVLAASLPPGSMTGAPKLRSCQILSETEKRERGVYSGVVGYMDVGGGGDFNVVIRSAFRWDGDADDSEEGGEDGQEERHRPNGGDEVEDGGENDQKEAQGHSKGKTDRGKGDEWTIGAGGAVTILSTEDGEWEEMIAKLRSTLRLFENGDEGMREKHASHWRH